MKFICDEMLHKLARWLRIMGLDTIDPQVENDRELARISQEQCRTLLTRDKDLSNLRGIDAVRIISDDLDEQLEQLVNDIPNLMDHCPTTRCPSCNGKLVPCSTESIDQCMIKDKEVPDDVITSFDIIYMCTFCTKVYWIGSHWKRITERLSRLGIEPILPTHP